MFAFCVNLHETVGAALLQVSAFSIWHLTFLHASIQLVQMQWGSFNQFDLSTQLTHKLQFASDGVGVWGGMLINRYKQGPNQLSLSCQTTWSLQISVTWMPILAHKLNALKHDMLNQEVSDQRQSASAASVQMHNHTAYTTQRLEFPVFEDGYTRAQLRMMPRMTTEIWIATWAHMWRSWQSELLVWDFTVSRNGSVTR